VSKPSDWILERADELEVANPDWPEHRAWQDACAEFLDSAHGEATPSDPKAMIRSNNVGMGDARFAAGTLEAAEQAPELAEIVARRLQTPEGQAEVSAAMAELDAAREKIRESERIDPALWREPIRAAGEQAPLQPTNQELLEDIRCGIGGSRLPSLREEQTALAALTEISRRLGGG
jgi:hypothetical protein